MKTDTCTDCGLSILYWVAETADGPVRLSDAQPGAEGPYGDHADQEHPGLCCDCFDENWVGQDNDIPFERTWARP